MRRLVATIWPLAVLMLVICVIVAAAAAMAPSTQRVVTDGLLKLIVVVGAYIFIGNSGVLSFGHIGFMAIGAYTSAWLTIPPMTKKVLLPGLPDFLMQLHWGTVPATIAGGVAAMVVALVAGLPLMRLSGIAASIGTFAMLAIIQATFSNWTSMTGGQGSLFGLPASTDMYVAGAWGLVTLAVAYAYQCSRFGFRLRSSREEEVASRASGVDVPRERLVAFVISAFFVGVAGSLHAHFLGVVTANQYFLALTFITLAMLVIGGINSLSGAVTGVLVVSVLAELLRRVEGGFTVASWEVSALPGLREVGLALAMLLILVWRPRGLTDGREIGWPGALYGKFASKRKSRP
ncbi:MAG: branched-chain amino acid ABC transporter permease [Alphaproteobacteria bacterium]